MGAPLDPPTAYPVPQFGGADPVGIDGYRLGGSHVAAEAWGPHLLVPGLEVGGTPVQDGATSHLHGHVFAHEARHVVRVE